MVMSVPFRRRRTRMDVDNSNSVSNVNNLDQTSFFVSNDSSLLRNPFETLPYQSSNDLINSLVENIFGNFTLQSLPSEDLLFGGRINRNKDLMIDVDELFKQDKPRESQPTDNFKVDREIQITSFIEQKPKFVESVQSSPEPKIQNELNPTNAILETEQFKPETKKEPLVFSSVEYATELDDLQKLNPPVIKLTPDSNEITPDDIVVSSEEIVEELKQTQPSTTIRPVPITPLPTTPRPITRHSQGLNRAKFNYVFRLGERELVKSRYSKIVNPERTGTLTTQVPKRIFQQKRKPLPKLIEQPKLVVKDFQEHITRVNLQDTSKVLVQPQLEIKQKESKQQPVPELNNPRIILGEFPITIEQQYPKFISYPRERKPEVIQPKLKEIAQNDAKTTVIDYSTAEEYQPADQTSNTVDQEQLVNVRPTIQYQHEVVHSKSTPAKEIESVNLKTPPSDLSNVDDWFDAERILIDSDINTKLPDEQAPKPNLPNDEKLFGVKSPVEKQNPPIASNKPNRRQAPRLEDSLVKIISLPNYRFYLGKRSNF